MSAKELGLRPIGDLILGWNVLSVFLSLIKKAELFHGLARFIRQ